MATARTCLGPSAVRGRIVASPQAGCISTIHDRFDFRAIDPDVPEGTIVKRTKLADCSGAFAPPRVSMPARGEHFGNALGRYLDDRRRGPTAPLPGYWHRTSENILFHRTLYSLPVLYRPSGPL